MFARPGVRRFVSPCVLSVGVFACSFIRLFVKPQLIDNMRVCVFACSIVRLLVCCSVGLVV